MKRLAAVVFGACLATPASPLSAQGLVVGSRIRVETKRANYTGILRERTGQQLTLRSSRGDLSRITVESIERVDLSLGRKRNVRKGVLFGALVMGSLAAVREPHSDYGEEPISKGLFVATNAALGAAVGALVGHFVKSERWREIEVGKPRVTLTLPARGVGAQVKVGW